MTILLLTVLAILQLSPIPWNVVIPTVGAIGGTVGYFIKQDKQISKQADRLLILEEVYKAQQAQIDAIKSSISTTINSVKQEILIEMKSQERETRELREKIIRMEERILAGIKRSHTTASNGP